MEKNVTYGMRNYQIYHRKQPEIDLIFYPLIVILLLTYNNHHVNLSLSLLLLNSSQDENKVMKTPKNTKKFYRLIY